MLFLKLAPGLFATMAAALPGADLLLTVHKRAETLGIYDLTDSRPVANVPAGVKPHEFAVTADGRFALVTGHGADTSAPAGPGGNSVAVVDLKACKPAGMIDLDEYRQPHGIERGRSGTFYVATENPPALLAIDQRRRRIKFAFPLPGRQPQMIAVSADESKVWTADAGSGTVTVMDLRTHNRLAQIDVGGIPAGLALSRNERRVYCATLGGNTVVVIDAVANRLRRRIGVAGQPARLLLSQDGRTLYVSLHESGEVAAIDTRTELEVRRVRAGAEAWGLGLHRSGESLFVAAQAENRILQLALPGLEVMNVIETAAGPGPVRVIAAP